MVRPAVGKGFHAEVLNVIWISICSFLQNNDPGAAELLATVPRTLFFVNQISDMTALQLLLDNYAWEFAARWTTTQSHDSADAKADVRQSLQQTLAENMCKTLRS